MKKLIFILLLGAGLEGRTQEKLIYHEIRTDAEGHIIPWYNNDPAVAYHHIVNLLWNFWDTMRRDINGIPYYMNHQVWRPDYDDPRGLGGDQIQMALSSWRLLYAYTGNERIKQNMKFMADYYLTHSLSPSNCKWPGLPFPYNTLIYSGQYDGDMVLGKDYTQPDKSGSLALELLHLYKMNSENFYLRTHAERYLQAAITIANTLSSHIENGDADKSPLPFKVNAITGAVGNLQNLNGNGQIVGKAAYTTNWSATLELFIELQRMKRGNMAAYKIAFEKIIAWMKKYPLRNNKWGPFFEDVQGWSDTQINAITFATFMMEHQALFPDWKKNVNEIFNWVYSTLGNENWKNYGVTVVNEQSVYKTPGQSHTARQGAVELLFCSLTGDTARKANAIRQLSWATYMVDTDGKNRFPQDENWLTDGYGDYVRHYLRAMAAVPELAPPSDHILSSTSVIQQADYRDNVNKFLVPYLNLADMSKLRIYYHCFDSSGTEKIRMAKRPGTILLEGKALNETVDGLEGFSWKPLNLGGLLTIHRRQGQKVAILE